MAFLTGKDKEYVDELLTKLPNKVELILFTQELNCEYCSDTHQLLKEVTEAGKDNLSLTVYNFQVDKEKVEEYNVDKAPAIVIRNEEKDFGIRYYGIPAGYEFSSILEDIQAVAAGSTSLSEESVKKLSTITEPLRLQVFVTPTCPYCPKAVLLAHQAAMANENIIADMVEATEFPELSQKYHVQGVPRTVIGEQQEHFIEGAVPESMMVDAILQGYEKMVSQKVN